MYTSYMQKWHAKSINEEIIIITNKWLENELNKINRIK